MEIMLEGNRLAMSVAHEETGDECAALLLDSMGIGVSSRGSDSGPLPIGSGVLF